MKASYHGQKFEVDSVIGKDGMEYPAQDVVLIEPDWSSFRREAAKDILCAMIQAGVDDAWRNVVPAAIEGADELIKQLKGEEI